MTHSSAAYLLLNIGSIRFSPPVTCPAQIVIVPGTVAFARKIASENREKMKQQAAVDPNDSWNHRRNGSAHILDVVDDESRRVVDFEIVQRANASERGNYQGNSSVMEWKWKQRGGW
jgi:uncharacterized protein YcgI (DUF1989 family)